MESFIEEKRPHDKNHDVYRSPNFVVSYIRPQDSNDIKRERSNGIWHPSLDIKSTAREDDQGEQMEEGSIHSQCQLEHEYPKIDICHTSRKVLSTLIEHIGWPLSSISENMCISFPPNMPYERGKKKLTKSRHAFWLVIHPMYSRLNKVHNG